MRVPDYSKNVIQSLDSIRPTQFADDARRYEAKEAARRLLNRLETPFEQGWRLSLETPVLIAGIQVALDLGIWEKWTEADKKKPGTAVDLEQLLKWVKKQIEPNLLRKPTFLTMSRTRIRLDKILTWNHAGRFFRHLAALYVLEETNVDTWKPTPYSLSLGDTESHTDQITQCGYVRTFTVMFDSLIAYLLTHLAPITQFPPGSIFPDSFRNTTTASPLTCRLSTTTAT